MILILQMMKISISIAALVVLYLSEASAFGVHSFVVAPQCIHHRRYVHAGVACKSSRGERMTRALNLMMSAQDRNMDVDVDVDGNGDDSSCSSVIFTQSAEDVHTILVDLVRSSQDEDTKVDLLLGMEDIKSGWVELNELIEFEELLPRELDQLYRNSSTSNSPSDKLDKKGFFTLYQLIDDLFFEPPDEDSDGDEQEKDDGSASAKENETETENNAQTISQEDPSSSSNTDPIVVSSEIKADLLSYLTEVHIDSDDDTNNKLSCGFDCTDEERIVIHDFITSLETNLSPSNLVTRTCTSKREKMNELQVMGEWDLLYTSSPAMIINRSLSGLGRTTSSKAQFQGFRKRLGGSKYLGTAEYIETFGGKEASFEVVVTGEWYFEEKGHAVIGIPAPSLRMELKKVIYGPTTNGADQWSSLGPIKLNDFLYLDEDLMILRGNANPNTLFIYQRVGVSS